MSRMQALVCALAALGLIAFRTVTSAWLPADGLLAGRGATIRGELGLIYDVGPTHTAGLAKGEVIEAVNGTSLHTAFVRTVREPFAFGPLPGPDRADYTVRGLNGQLRTVSVPLAPSWVHGCSSGFVVCSGAFSFVVLWLVLAVWVFVRRPHEPAASLMLVAALAEAVYVVFDGVPAQFHLLRHPLFIWLSTITIGSSLVLVVSSILHQMLMIPDIGTTTPRNTLRREAVVLHALPQALLWSGWGLSAPAHANPFEWFQSLPRWVSGVLAALMLLGVLAVLWRYARLADPYIKRQYRAVGLGLMLIMSLLFALVRFPIQIGPLLIDATVSPWLVLPMPVLMAATIMRAQRFNVMVLVSKALVFCALAAILIAANVALAQALRLLLPVANSADFGVLLALVSAAMSIALFALLRKGIERIVSRIVFGAANDPATTLAAMTQRITERHPDPGVLGAVAESIGLAMRVPWVEVTVDGLPRARWQHPQSVVPATRWTALPLSYNQRTVGMLELGERPPSDRPLDADHRLLGDLARQAGIAAFLARQSLDLQHSRERLVSTREEERQRIRRDLHDGLGPSLGSLVMGLDAARNTLQRAPQAADSMLEQLRDQAHQTVNDVRGLVYDLRPPALDQLGLLPALREFAQRIEGRSGLQIDLVMLSLPRIPAAQEVALYRIATEALNNVVRHAGARHAEVRIAHEEGSLLLAIADDGAGMSPDAREGVGLRSMRERVEELGGSLTLDRTAGTRVMVRLPAGAADARNMQMEADGRD